MEKKEKKLIKETKDMAIIIKVCMWMAYIYKSQHSMCPKFKSKIKFYGANV